MELRKCFWGNPPWSIGRKCLMWPRCVWRSTIRSAISSGSAHIVGTRRRSLEIELSFYPAVASHGGELREVAIIQRNRGATCFP